MFDGGVIEHTTFCNKLKNNSLNIPQSEEQNGNEAFALSPNFLLSKENLQMDGQYSIIDYHAFRLRIFHTNIN